MTRNNIHTVFDKEIAVENEYVRIRPLKETDVSELRAVFDIPLTEEKAEEMIALSKGAFQRKEEADLASLRELASLLDGKLAASRPLVDNGWLPHEKQIGQSGTTVKPRLIFNIAISGSVQYQVGMQNASCIISVNHTKGAPIFDISHYGVVGDYKTVIPALVEEIKIRKS